MCSFVLFGFAESKELQWGESIRIGMSKKEINLLIKEYVQKKYPQKVQEYHNALNEQRLSKLKKYSHETFVDGDFMWQDNNDNLTLKYNTLEAKIYCRRLHFATKKDWRLPSYAELLTLLDYNRFEPASRKGLEYVALNRYWTSSMSFNDVSADWYVDFKYGQTGTALKENGYNIRCVRNLSKVEGEF